MDSTGEFCNLKLLLQIEVLQEVFFLDRRGNNNKFAIVMCTHSI